jgi:WD40 repeat protein
MKITSHLIFISLIMISLLGCVSPKNEFTSTPQMVQTVNEPENTKTPVPEPTLFSGNLYLSGRINSNLDQIYIIDLSKKTIDKLLSDRQCFFLPKTYNEFCFQKCEYLPEKADNSCEFMELIDAQTKEPIFRIDRKIDHDNSRISGNGEYFDILQKENEKSLVIERYSLVDGNKVIEDEAQGYDWGSFPSLSEDGKSLISPVSVGGKGKLFLFDLLSKNVQEIFEFNNESFIPSIEWAENSNEFIIQTLPWSGDVTAPCTKILYFNIETNSSKRIIDRDLISPCFLIDSAVISPDGKKIAVEMDDGLEYYGICIYSTQNDQQQCIKNVDQGNRISFPIWNPTSDSIAFIDTNNQVFIYNADEGKSELITTINETGLVFPFAWNQ